MTKKKSSKLPWIFIIIILAVGIGSILTFEVPDSPNIQTGSIDDTFAGLNLRIEYDADLETIKITNKDTGEIVDSVYSFWFAWVAVFPNTEIFEI